MNTSNSSVGLISNDLSLESALRLGPLVLRLVLCRVCGALGSRLLVIGACNIAVVLNIGVISLVLAWSL